MEKSQQAEKAARAIEKKWEALKSRLKEENPEVYEEMVTRIREVEKTWIKVSPFVGEEEAYGKSSQNITGEQEVIGTPFDHIWWFVLSKIISEKIQRELEWFKENKEVLEMMVKEYLAAQRLR